MRTLALLLLVGCAHQGPAAPPAGDGDLDLLVRRLSAQHPPSDCDEVVAGLTDPRTALRRAVIEVEMPPWVGMISGQCLTRRYATEEEATLIAWIADPELAGLARSIVRDLPLLSDEGVVLRLGAAALRSSIAPIAREVLATDTRPAVRALVEAP